MDRKYEELEERLNCAQDDSETNRTKAERVE